MPIRPLAREVRDRYRKWDWNRSYANQPPPFSNSAGAAIGEAMKAKGIEKDFGAFVYTTKNVGDEVQSIAQIGFLPQGQDIVPLDRDLLGEYDGKKRVAIMNGWFNHRPDLWPPSDQIDPIYYSFHIAHNILADAKYAEYFKRHEPIGCRDMSTMKMLQDIGVEAYFSGCCTLTLQNPYSAEDRTDEVVVLDAHLDDKVTYPPGAGTIMKRLVPESILKNARYLEQEVPDTDYARYGHKTSRALELLDTYAKAKLVITSRLHCTLPCLALGTPVILLHPNWDNDLRFDGFRDKVPGFGPDTTELLVDWSNPQPTDISAFRNGIINGLVERVRARVGL